jgi:ribosomal protein L14E/L6E/L27E
MGPADIVISLAGHDRGEAFVVLEANEQSVLVADGKNRKLSRPKRKNTKHINLGRPGSDEIARAIGSGNATDRQLRRELAQFRSEAAKTEEGKSACQKMM